MLLGRGDGPIPSRIMIVGEAWGEEEARLGQSFVGASGAELNRMLHEAGIMRSECFITNLVNARPPGNDIGAWIAAKKKDVTAQHVQLRERFVLPHVRQGYDQLLTEIAAVQPNLILALGNTAMWSLTGNWGILKWRGSHLRHEESGAKVIPTLHPAAVLREWSMRAAAVADIKRARRELTSRNYSRPDWKFQISPSLPQVEAWHSAMMERLSAGEVWLDFDIETKIGHIACAGISWSLTEAICIPFLRGLKPYWGEEEEALVVWLIREVLTHKNARVRWQNGLYDAQYTWRWWHFVPKGAQDTMISQHCLFVAQPKALAYQASVYANWFVYWKDEGKNLDGQLTDERNWAYNCQDCIYTREVGEVELATAERLGMGEPHRTQQELFWPVLEAMKLGLRVRHEVRDRLALEISEEIDKRSAFLRDILGFDLNPASSPQMTKLFYEDFQQPPIMTRAKKGIPGHLTCDDEALQKIAAREPLLRPIISALSDMRTLRVFLSTFINAKLDIDGRMRCSFNIGGNAKGKSAPYTLRLSSSKNAFDSGANLQNIPSEKSKSLGKAAARSALDRLSFLGDPLALPNIRSMFGPDAGMTFFDMDLDRADLQVMAWDADEPVLKEVLRKKVDTHLFNVYVLDNQEPPPLEELVEDHPKYPDHRGPRKHKREFAKVFCHATDYLGKARTVAAATGRTVAEVERSQRTYLGMYKGIKKWQDSIIEQVRKRRFVENKFGYRWYIFDRIDDQIMPEAVAWIPQSTVGCLINRIWLNIWKHERGCQVLLQVHDSLAGQFPSHRKAYYMKRLPELAAIPIPYADPLVIPVGLATSDVSWGDCE